MRYQHSTSRKAPQIRILPNRAASLTATNIPRLPQPPGHHALTLHTHTELLSREDSCPHLLATSGTHPCSGCSHKRGFEAKHNYPMFWFKHLQFISKASGFLPALGYISPRQRSSHNPQAPSLMAFGNVGQDQTVPGGICIRSCQPGKFPHKVHSLGAALASLHTHIPWQMQGRSFTPLTSCTSGCWKRGMSGLVLGMSMWIWKRRWVTHTSCTFQGHNDLSQANRGESTVSVPPGKS